MKWVDAPPSLPRGASVVVIEGKPSEPEHVTVLAGTLNFAMGDRFDAEKFKAMRAGSFVPVPVGTNDFVEAQEETVVQLHGVGSWDVKYVNREADPRKK
jgi:hypothetical protein